MIKFFRSNWNRAKGLFFATGLYRFIFKRKPHQMDVQNRREIFIVFIRALREGVKNTPIPFCHTLFRIRLCYFTADGAVFGVLLTLITGSCRGSYRQFFYSSGHTERVQQRFLILALDKLDMRVRDPGFAVYTATVILSPNFCASVFPPVCSTLVLSISVT